MKILSKRYKNRILVLTASDVLSWDIKSNNISKICDTKSVSSEHCRIVVNESFAYIKQNSKELLVLDLVMSKIRNIMKLKCNIDDFYAFRKDKLLMSSGSNNHITVYNLGTNYDILKLDKTEKIVK